jgi:hypothetical protein
LKGNLSQSQLEDTGALLRQRHWQHQSQLDFVPVGDFSFYDQVLDMSFLLGNIPARVRQHEGNTLDNYFRVARGRSAQDTACHCVHAGEMTKWFDTNYHYIVPEFDAPRFFPRCLAPAEADQTSSGTRRNGETRHHQSRQLSGLGKQKTHQINWPCCPSSCLSMHNCWIRWQPKAWSGCRSMSQF